MVVLLLLAVVVVVAALVVAVDDVSQKFFGKLSAGLWKLSGWSLMSGNMLWPHVVRKIVAAIMDTEHSTFAWNSITFSDFLSLWGCKYG